MPDEIYIINVDEYIEGSTKNEKGKLLFLLKRKWEKINYMTYIKQMKNEECNNAIKRLLASINMYEIKKFIDSIECMSDIRKNFYKNIIKQRYDIIKKVYENIK